MTMGSKRQAKLQKNAVGKQNLKETTTESKLPKYREIVHHAIKTLNSPGGVSQQDMLGIIISKYRITDAKKARRSLDVALKAEMKADTILKFAGNFYLRKNPKPPTDGRRPNKRRKDIQNTVSCTELSTDESNILKDSTREKLSSLDI